MPMLRSCPHFPDLPSMSTAPIPIPTAGRWPADVELWRVELDLESADVCRFLAADEIERVARYVRHADRVRFAVARSVLREILGAYCGCDPLQLTFTAGA